MTHEQQTPKRRYRPRQPKVLNGIFAARLNAGMTQSEAGQLIGLPGPLFWRIENGTMSLKAHDALVLCRTWNVTLEQLLEKVPARKPRALHAQDITDAALIGPQHMVFM